MGNSEQPQIVRQWMLLQTLRSRRFGLTIQEMVDETGVGERTIRRDLATLQTLGFPFTKERVSNGGAVRWRIPPDARLTTLSFTWEEAMALYFGRQYLTPLAGTMIWQSVNSGFKKIRACLGERALKYLEDMKDAFHHIQCGTSDYHEKSEIINQLSIAVEDRSPAIILYQSLNATEPVEYEINPYGIVFHRHSLYLVAHSHDHGEIRTFKIDRVDEVAEVSKLPFERPADFDLEEHLADSFGVFHGDGPLKTVRVRFAAGSAARVVQEGRWHASQQLEKQRDGSVHARFELSDLHEITSWILSFGSQATVLEPSELCERIADELRRSLAQLETSYEEAGHELKVEDRR